MGIGVYIEKTNLVFVYKIKYTEHINKEKELKTMKNTTQELLGFIATCTSPYHTVATSRKLLTDNGFAELKQADSWHLAPGGKYFTTVYDSTLLAFRIGAKASTGLKIAAAHTDFPCFRIKPQAGILTEGYGTLNVEGYGGMNFVRENKSYDSNKGILSFILNLSKWLGVPTIVEGVETKAELRLVATMGCDFVQGYYFAKPMPEEEFIVYLDKHVRLNGVAQPSDK